MLTLGRIQTSLFLPSLPRIFSLYNLDNLLCSCDLLKLEFMSLYDQWHSNTVKLINRNRSETADKGDDFIADNLLHIKLFSVFIYHLTFHEFAFLHDSFGLLINNDDDNYENSR